HERLGVPLMEYLTRFRLEVARHLLTASRLTIDQVAGEAGFSSASHLSRAFLAHSGYRPGNYRRRVRMAGMWPPQIVPVPERCRLRLARRGPGGPDARTCTGSATT